MKALFLSTLTALLAVSLGSLHAQEEDPTAKMRDQLRSTMLELRKAQTEIANAQAQAAAADMKVKGLEESITQLEARNAQLVKQSNEDKASAEESIATLNKKLAEREVRITQFEEALAKWKDGYQKAAEIARTKESERANLASEAIVLNRTIADRERKNINLYNTALEILDRLENYSLGKALGAREPFIGTQRVKVENMVQEYKDKIIDNRIAAPSPKP